MSDQKEIVMVTDREKFIASTKTKKITTLSGVEKNVYELPSGEFQHLYFSGYKRPECEKNYDFIQMIPYIILRDIDRVTGAVKYLTYKRGKKGAENKLHDKFSVGVGGHIAVNHYVDPSLKSDHVYIQHYAVPAKIVVSELVKEIQEETGFNMIDQFTFEELDHIVMKASPFYLDEGPESVNSYHFALPIAINVHGFADAFISNEPGVIEKLSWKTPEELKVLADEGALEAWTDIVLKNFIPPVITAEFYEQATGNKPIQGDILRANCSKAGTVMHHSCGWCVKNNVPNTFGSAARWQNINEKSE